MDIFTNMITELGVLGLMIYLWRAIQTERLVTGGRFRDLQERLSEVTKERDDWRARAENGLQR